MSAKELLVFEVSGHLFAVPLPLVEEVVHCTAITPIPSSPPFLLGLAAVRGRVVGVIDCARRYGLPASLSSYFLVCLVRGNPTAITVDRPVQAGELPVRELSADEVEALRGRCRVDGKFVRGGYELLERLENSEPASTGLMCLEIDPNLFVSAEMASRVGEAA